MATAGRHRRKAAAAPPAAVTCASSCNYKGGSLRGWALSLPRRILRARSRLSKFYASTLDPNCANPLVRATDLFPCPPLPEARSAAPKNGHARARWSLRIAARRWTNVALACFTWDACGRPALAPATARCGTPSVCSTGGDGRSIGVASQIAAPRRACCSRPWNVTIFGRKHRGDKGAA